MFPIVCRSAANAFSCRSAALRFHPLSAALLDGNQPTTEEGLSRGAARQKTFAAERQTMSKCQSGNWRYRETKRTPAVAGVLEKIHLTFCYFPFNRIGVPGTQSAGIGRR